MKTTLKFILVLDVLVLSILLTTSSMFAGGGPSPEKCEEMGMLDVDCIVCETGEYLGKISVKAEYDPDYRDCGGRYREARQKCADFYVLELSKTGCKWSHSMGGKTYRGWYPDYCKH